MPNKSSILRFKVTQGFPFEVGEILTVRDGRGRTVEVWEGIRQIEYKTSKDVVYEVSYV